MFPHCYMQWFHCTFLTTMQSSILLQSLTYLTRISSESQLVIFSAAFNASAALRSSLITDDKASGLIPCSQSRTHIDRVSISNPVFKILEISSRTSMVSLTAFRFAAAAPTPLLLAMAEANGGGGGPEKGFLTHLFRASTHYHYHLVVTHLFK